MPRATPLAATAATLTLTLAACTTTGAHDDADQRPLALTTFTILADMVDNIAGDRVQVASLTRPGSEIHGYEPTPDDLLRGTEADLLLENGLGLETWFEQFTEQIEAPTHTLTEGIQTIPITSGAHEGEPNPHAWMSPDNGPTYVDNIQKALTELDPDGARTYEQNAQNEGTPQQIAQVTSFVQDNDVPTLFCESTVNDSTQQAIAHDTGTHLGPTLYVDSLSPEEGPVPTYLDLLRHDTHAIAQALTPPEQEHP